ncbi:MAG TPA: hypothetical protein VGX92_07570 [Pyrinomonadaceae bacterium]|jgi:hypothetical protein|nr:hypothetical protein [Pyrinomonadaceae bacterium]
MKPLRRPLLLIVLVLILFVCGMALAASRTIRSSAAAPVAGCAEDCKEKLDKMLEKCEQIPEARRGVCREAANAHYDKCTEKCADRAR